MLLHDYSHGLIEAMSDKYAVFIVSCFEKFAPIIPSYVLFPAIGMGSENGLDLLLRCAIATAGSVIGALCWYLLGAGLGPDRARRLVERYGAWALLRLPLYDRMAASYRNKAFSITAIGQMIPTVRIFQALPAGVLRLPLLPFLLATAVGAHCWILALSVAGYLLRQHGLSATEVGVGMLLALLSIEGTACLVAIAVSKRCR